MRGVLLLGGLLAACAEGTTTAPGDAAGNVDARIGTGADARPVADAHPIADAGPGQPDATAPADAAGVCSLAPPTGLAGCPSCGEFCDAPWPASWGAVAGATHYIVQYTCFITTVTYQTASTSVDLCNQVGMCTNDDCAFGAGPVQVKACDATCCSALATVPALETPIACGGGVCC